MTAKLRAAERAAWRVLSTADAACNRLYGWRLNPLYQSGTIVVLLLLVLLVTGTWLLLFYRVGSPWASVERITASPVTGNWVRTVHRYASDAAIIATVAHLARMFAQGRNWGPRVLAWVSGATLLALLLVSGWTGFAMVWDEFGQLLALEGSRMLDALPILSEPVSRIFSGERPVSNAFFFVTLFAHVAVPLGMGLGLWLHVSRVARVTLLPPRGLSWAVGGGLVALALAWPLEMAPEASAFRVPERIAIDWYYAFWLPLSRQLSGGAALAVGVLAFGVLAAIPLVTRRHPATAPRPSQVDEAICVGCVQCSLDCPYQAIQMVARVSRRSDFVARVDPALCVSCGICAGSCAPMGVGPPGRTGRDQLAAARAFIAAGRQREAAVVVVGCDRTAAGTDSAARAAGGVPYPVDCAGSLHTSVIELLVRAGAGGVMVLACPPRDCWNREGPRWIRERMDNKREAELQERVDRRRVRILHADAHDVAAVRIAVEAFAADIATLDMPAPTEPDELDLVCEPAVREVG